MIRRRLQRVVRSSLRSAWHRFQDSEFKWRYVDNLRSSFDFRFRPPPLDDTCARIVADLARDGIAITTIDQLFRTDHPWRELVETVSRIEREQADAMTAARTTAISASVGHKSYLYAFLPRRVTLPTNHAFVAFARSEPLQNIADAYFAMRTELRQVNVWYNFATPHSPSASQFWHRDREDRSILKVFVYLDDVTETRGPLTYAPRTHRAGDNEPESFHEPGHKNARSTDDQMTKLLSRDEWRSATGPKGTVVFADTSGFHKGGEVRDGERHVFVCMFTSPACREELLVIENES